MTIQRKPLLVVGALLAFFVLPRFEMLLPSALLDRLPFLKGRPAAEADSLLVQLTWVAAIALLFLPWRIAKPLGWSVIAWKFLDTFKRNPRGGLLPAE